MKRHLPNIISLLRLFSLPLLIVLFLRGQYPLFTGIFILAALSDILDGYVARHLKVESPLGRMLDPLADKVLLGGLFILLSLYKVLPLWLMILCVIRDITIMVGVGVLKKKGISVTQGPSRISKINTFFQMLLVLSVLMVLLNGQCVALPYLVIMTACTTCYSGVDYGLRFWRLIKQK